VHCHEHEEAKAQQQINKQTKKGIAAAGRSKALSPRRTTIHQHRKHNNNINSSSSCNNNNKNAT
jgi:hypothetical protein